MTPAIIKDEGQVFYSATMPNIDEKYLLSPHTMNECAIGTLSLIHI